MTLLGGVTELPANAMLASTLPVMVWCRVASCMGRYVDKVKNELSEWRRTETDSQTGCVAESEVLIYNTHPEQRKLQDIS